MVTLRPMLLKYNTIRQRQIGMPKLIHFLVLIAKHVKVIMKFTNLETLYFDVTQHRIIFAYYFKIIR